MHKKLLSAENAPVQGGQKSKLQACLLLQMCRPQRTITHAGYHVSRIHKSATFVDGFQLLTKAMTDDLQLRDQRREQNFIVQVNTQPR